MQSDDKILLTGWANFKSGTYSDISTVRYNADGSLDSTFGNGGIVSTRISATLDDVGTAVTVQPDGKIIVGGYTALSSADRVWAIMRYETNGALDTTFGTNGISTLAFGVDRDQGSAVGLQSTGKIIQAGWDQTGNSDWDFAVARWTTSGALDTTFGTSGKTTFNFSAGDNTLYAMAIQADDNISVGGYAPGKNSAIARLTANGALDSTFGTGGKVTMAVSAGDDQISAIALDADENIIVTGEYNTGGSNTGLYVRRLLPNGTLDTTFGTSGTTTLSIGTINHGYGVTFQADGKIIVTGYSLATFRSVIVARLNTDGTFDTTFNTTGYQTYNFSGGSDTGIVPMVQSTGRIVIGGYSSHNSGDYAVFRIWP